MLTPTQEHQSSIANSHDPLQTRLPNQAATQTSPEPPSRVCRRLLLDQHNMDRNSQYKKRRTKANSPDLTMIVQMIVTTKQSTQLATVPLLQDHHQQDLVHSKIWRVLQNFIAKLALQSDFVIDPINITRDLGFPCVAHLSAFYLSRGKAPHDATSVLPNFISTSSASDAEQNNCENHSYLQCLSDYTFAAERAIASAQVLRELVCRSENAVQSLQIEYENDIEHLKKYAPPPSAIRHHIQVNVDKEMVLLLHSLKVLFEGTQHIVGELEYRLQVQVAQKGV
jgi:hypothetical protein